MSSGDTCRECGAPIPADSPGGFCAQCLLALGLQKADGLPADIAPTISPHTMTEKPGDRIGRYRLLQEIGHGGCGVVFMAEQEEPVRRRVALKVIKLGMDTREVIARFEAERQALALMDHPNISKVLDAGATEAGRPYFVMELVRGVKITEFCDEAKLSTRERLHLFIQVCQAIQHAHQKGVIHRDIKPSNVLVTVNDGVPMPKVIDFGIAKATAGRLTDKTLFTAFEQFMGTPAYMSPEQAVMTSLDIDTRSDIYSLGVLLYELFTGKTPFDTTELLRAGLDELRRTIREQEPARPSTRVSALRGEELTTTAKRRGLDAPKLIQMLRGDLDWIVMKCLEKDRMRRYETANGLARDIERHLNNEPVVARPPSTAYRVQKFVRRNKVIVTAATSIVVVLVLGIVASAWQAMRATHAKRDAVRERQRAEGSAKDLRRTLYASQMNIAYQSWQMGDADRTRTVLTNQIPRAGEEDLRGWEWHYLWSRSRLQEIKTLEIGGNPSGLAASPDGSIFATHGFYTPLQLWDAASLRPIVTLTNDLAANGYTVAFSRDGKKLLSTHSKSKPPLVLLWDVRERRPLGMFTNHTMEVLSAVFTPDGKAVISTGGRAYTTNRIGELKLWDASTFRELGEFEHVEFPLLRCDVSPDGRFVAASGVAQVISIWDLRSRKLIARLAGHETKSIGHVIGLRFSPDGEFLATGDFGGTVRLWNLRTNRNDWRINEPIVLGTHGQPILSLVFSPDGKRLVSTGQDHTAKLWDVPNQKELRTLRGHAGRVWNAAFIRDGTNLVTTGNDGKLKLWDANLASEDNVFAGSAAREKRERGLAGYSTDGRFLAWMNGQVIRIWDLAKSNDTRQINGGKFAFSPATNALALVSPAGRLQIWSLDSFSEVAGPGNVTVANDEWTDSLAFSQRGNRLAAIGPGGEIRVWTVAGWNELLKIEAKANWVLFALDGETVLSGRWDAEITQWRSATGARVATFGLESSGEQRASISPDGRFLATSSGGGTDTVRLWDVATRREIARFKGGSDKIMSLAFSKDENTVVAGTFDGVIQLWNVASGQQVATLRGHISFVDSLAFSPDGRTLASSSMDNTLRLWKAPSYGN